MLLRDSIKSIKNDDQLASKEDHISDELHPENRQKE